MRPPRPHLCRTLLREGSAPRSRSARSSSSSLHVLIDSRPGCLPATRCCGDVHHRPIARCCLLLALASCLRSSGDFAHLTVDSSHFLQITCPLTLILRLSYDCASCAVASTSPLAHWTSRLALRVAARSTNRLVLRVHLRLLGAACLASRDTRAPASSFMVPVPLFTCLASSS